ncbi:potassium transporter Kef, partial [Vibrio parahaemolyticus]|nr:potassium transporter Kef [Vibrio parahaemolyticus]
SASLSVNGVVLALLFILLLPIKGLLYFVTINHFKFRVRTSLLASLSLFNYSEFGLIVAGLAYKMGWMPSDMLAAIAVAVSVSFVISAPLNRLSDKSDQHSGNFLQDAA